MRSSDDGRQLGHDHPGAPSGPRFHHPRAHDWGGTPWGARRHHPHGGRPGGGPPGEGPWGLRGGFPGEHRERGRHGGRAGRGDVRNALLVLLADEPMHGYQLMQAAADRTGGAWRLSPGAVYPTIAQLEDEGLVQVTPEGGRKLVTLTAQGREHLAALGDVDPFAAFGDEGGRTDLREPLAELMGAARQLARSGSAAQLAEAARVLAEARRSLYLLLAGETPAPSADPGPSTSAG